MKSMTAHVLVVGVPGLCFVIFGAINKEYPVVGLGGILVVESVYGIIQKRVIIVDASDRGRQRHSFILAGIIGASFAAAGFASCRYVLAAAGTVIFVGALLRIYGMRLAKNPRG